MTHAAGIGAGFELMAWRVGLEFGLRDLFVRQDYPDFGPTPIGYRAKLGMRLMAQSPRQPLYSVPVLMTGCTSLSAQSTVIRFDTIAARRSSSSSTTCFADSSVSAISTIDTAP